ncbi:RTA-like protein [Niveomyces insectorum RCEF 264]|uniref:RTA-like protein n=1 Tax=Niveomyces insectorum RCEF 264 TaxID=1081102 RepID=A0A167PRU7_9HYPO|nr:RTA-like protein [Niveomyces insectorum RCEF 264]
MENGKVVDGSIYFYAPNKGAPVFFAAAFLASGLYHVWQCRRYRSWRLTGLYVFCCTLFTAGFVVREVGAFAYTNVNVYIATVCLVYAAPPIFELANYIVLGRILYYVPHRSPIHPGRVLTTFAAVSSVVEALNGNGAAYSANASLPQSKQDVGHALLKAALLLQIVVVAAFLLLAAVFQRRTRAAGIRNANLTHALATLYASEALLLARTLYRVVEYFSVADLNVAAVRDPQTLSPILRYEWFFYVFEATLMLCNTVLLNVRHPRHYLPATTKTYLARDGVTEITGPGYKEERHFLATLFDPFDLYGLFNGRDKKTAFWEQQEAAMQQQPQPQEQSHVV